MSARADADTALATKRLVWRVCANCGHPTRAVREMEAHKLPKQCPRCGSTDLKTCCAGEPGQ